MSQDVIEGEYEVGYSGEPDRSLLATVKVTVNCDHVHPQLQLLPSLGYLSALSSYSLVLKPFQPPVGITCYN